MKECFHVLSEDTRLASLGVSEIHRFVQKLIHHHKVISDTLFLDLTEVILEDICESIKEKEEEGDVGVLLGHRE